jgi:hypothetical protein
LLFLPLILCATIPESNTSASVNVSGFTVGLLVRTFSKQTLCAYRLSIRYPN